VHDMRRVLRKAAWRRNLSATVRCIQDSVSGGKMVSSISGRKAATSRDSTITFTPYSIRPQRTRLAAAVSAALIAGTAVQPLHAQELEEIVVTATKRAESVMDVPLAITAMSGD